MLLDVDVAMEGPVDLLTTDHWEEGVGFPPPDV